MTLTDLNFEGAGPDSRVPYTQIHRDIPDGCVYRLCDEKRKIWSFYNDSKEDAMRVWITFPGEPGKKAAVTALGKVKASTLKLPGKEGGGPLTAQRLSVTLNPQETATVLTYKEASDIADAELEFRRETAPSDPATVHYVGGTRATDGVTVRGPDPAVLPSFAAVYKCFKGEGSGLFFRLVDPLTKRWAFYNDTQEYRMRVTVQFTDASEVTPLGHTRTLKATHRFNDKKAAESSPLKNCHKSSVTGSFLRGSDKYIGRAMLAGDDDFDGSTSPHPITQHLYGKEPIVYDLVVPPLTTELFIQGDPDNFVMAFAADPVENEEPEYDPIKFERDGPDSNVIEFDQLYRCYKNKGNGLLFRLVDTENEKWAFYNDTAKVSFTVIVKLVPRNDNNFSVVPPTTVEYVSTPKEAASPDPQELPGEPKPEKARRHHKTGKRALGASQHQGVLRADASGGETAILTLVVPPGKTVLMLENGIPEKYQITFKGTMVNEELENNASLWPAENATVREEVAVPEESLKFRGPGPQRHVSRHQKVYPCLFGPTQHCLLYRLVNENANCWSYYNDSDEVGIFVEVRFACPQPEPSLIVALGADTKLQYVKRTSPSAPHVVLYYIIATTTIPPQETLPFVQERTEGVALPYLVYYRTARAPDRRVVFRHEKELTTSLATLKFRKDSVYKGFLHSGNGLIFRLVETLESKAKAPDNVKGKDLFVTLTKKEEEDLHVNEATRWAYFNDTEEFIFFVSVRFDARSQITPLGRTVLTREERKTASTALSTSHSFASIPSTRGTSPMVEDLESPTETDHAISADLAAMVERRKREDSSPSREELVLTVPVPPLTTELFLTGTVVGHYAPVIRADAKPENTLIAFENALPVIYTSEEDYKNQNSPTAKAKAKANRKAALPLEDALSNPSLRFYRIFPSHRNGVLFRIVDDVHHIWSFYNDSSDFMFIVKVVFLKKSTVRKLGKAFDATDAERAKKGEGSSHSTAAPTPRSRSGSRSGSALGAAAAPPLQRRLSDVSKLHANGAKKAEVSAGPPPPRNFFEDPSVESDDSALVLQVEVKPMSTEILAETVDVVRFLVNAEARPFRTTK